MAEKGYVTYFEAINKIIKKIQETQGENIEKAAEIVADAVVKGGVLHVYGAGHSNCIAEEIFFRGFLFAALRRRMRAPFAVMLSAAAFALIHPFGEPMLAAFVLGLVVATVYEYSGSLLPPIMAHMGLNLSFVLFMAFKGELASAVPRWVFIATAAVFVGHFFLSSRYLFRRAR